MHELHSRSVATYFRNDIDSSFDLSKKDVRIKTAARGGVSGTVKLSNNQNIRLRPTTNPREFLLNLGSRFPATGLDPTVTHAVSEVESGEP